MRSRVRVCHSRALCAQRDRPKDMLLYWTRPVQRHPYATSIRHLPDPAVPPERLRAVHVRIVDTAGRSGGTRAGGACRRRARPGPAGRRRPGRASVRHGFPRFSVCGRTAAAGPSARQLGLVSRAVPARPRAFSSDKTASRSLTHGPAAHPARADRCASAPAIASGDARAAFPPFPIERVAPVRNLERVLILRGRFIWNGYSTRQSGRDC